LGNSDTRVNNLLHLPSTIIKMHIEISKCGLSELGHQPILQI